MLNAALKFPVAMRLTQLAMCLSAALALDHEAMATAVTNCGDGASANTLRHVIMNAASGDITDVSQCSLITLTAGAIPSALSRLRIQGNGSNVISGGGNSAILHHTGTGGYLRLIDVTIQDGNLTAANALGGCIYSTENVDLDHATIKNCLAQETATNGVARGGGLYSKGNVDLRNSIVTGNTATQQSSTFYGSAKGGGIYAQSLSAYNSVLSSNTANFTGGTTGVGKYTQGGGAFILGGVRVYTSTINGNQAGKYAGAFGGGVNIVNSTVSSNTAMRKGGGVWASGNLIIANSTVAFNVSAQPNAPAGAHGDGVVTLQSSIVANNTFSNGVESDLQLGASASFGPASANNIVMSSSGPVPLPADTIHADPHLLPLADNGGSTATHPVALTHALRQDSPALNRGNTTFEINFVPISCDQRGNPTQNQSNPPVTDHCISSGFRRVDTDPLHSLPDIGAYEEQLPNADWIFYDGHEGNYH
jgi:hypothetical protein